MASSTLKNPDALSAAPTLHSQGAVLTLGGSALDTPSNFETPAAPGQAALVVSAVDVELDIVLPDDPQHKMPSSTGVTAPTDPAEAPPTTFDLVDQSIVLLDPHLVVVGAEYNRSAESFDDEAFNELRGSIAAHRTNVQPICVVERIDSEGKTRHELVFGERRLRACRVENVSVRAMVMQERSGTGKALLRLSENRGRRELLPLEFGRQVKAVLDDHSSGLDKRRLAAILGCSPGHVGRAYFLASLPPEVMIAFKKPLELQYAYVARLRSALDGSPDAVAQEAERIRDELEPVATPVVVDRLERAAEKAAAHATAEVSEPKGNVASARGTAPSTKPQILRSAAGREIGHWEVLPSGSVAFQINESMSELDREALAAALVKQVETRVLKSASKTRRPQAPLPDAVESVEAGEQA